MKRVTPVLQPLAFVSHTFRTSHENIIQQIESDNIEGIRRMAKQTFLEDLGKLTYDDGSITIPHSNVFIEKEKIFSDDLPETSKTYTIFLKTYCVDTKRKIISNKKIRKNPAYEGNPNCEFCHKKVIKIFNDNLLNAEKTPIKVCKKCKQELKVMRNLVSEMKH